jgi:sporulation protein YlmC with PRC-barrel domain
LVTVNEVIGKSVVGSKGVYIGDVCNIYITPKDWKVTHLFIKLSGQAIKEFGMKKTLKGNVVQIPTSTIAKIDVLVTLNQTLSELKGDYSPVTV